LVKGQQGRDRLTGQLPLLVGEVVEKVGPVVVVLAHVMVVDRLLDEPISSNKRVNAGGRGVSFPEERFAVDLADVSPADLDDRIRADHLQVEHEPAWLDRFDHLAQDVHDVLGLDSSE
jgi:hypothetical protein